MIDDVLCAEYVGPCETCQTERRFVFEVSEDVHPISEEGITFGGKEPSHLLDPGDWLHVADLHAERTSNDARDLQVACAAVEEVLKFIADGEDAVHASSFFSDCGRAMFDADPGRFRRARLEAVLSAYREQVGRRVGSR